MIIFARIHTCIFVEMSWSISVPYPVEIFARKALKEFDESHDYDHGVRVWENAQKILRALNGQHFDWPDIDIIMCACVLHDTLDHKYKEQQTVTRDDVRQLVIGVFGSPDAADTVVDIIDNISWSAERAGRNRPLPHRDVLRQIVQCADWMDALGMVGIKRCRDYSLAHGSTPETVEADIVKHIEDKLSLIRDHLALVEARDLAEPLHNEIMTWYRAHKA